MSDPPNSTEPTDPQPPFASTSSPVTRPVTAIPLKRTFRPILPKPTTFTYSAEGNFPPTSPDEVIEPHLISDPGLSDSVASTDPSVVTTSVASTSDGTFYEWRHVDLILAEKARVVYDTLGRKRLLCPMPGCRATEAYLSGMRVHIRRHIGDRPFACSRCSATFVRMSDLQRHVRSHVLNGPQVSAKGKNNV
ncbi:unnamed protein product [Mesocestoides corti]|uniref:C2H2-type domain-containing protein n=1 Tax=Mesocestoides corti TaxID=53468 RepID=A0A0R3UIH1_MESCO|nr:unnamed protein product [Mesocestoides corti]